MKIGVSGVTDNIDDTKIGMRKHSCRHTVDGFWVIVGIKKHKK